jgi:agmatine/peptidylarginine deiminase
VRSLLLTATAAALPLSPVFAAPSVKPVPEFAPVQAVLLSEDLFSAGYHAPELLAEIVAAKAQPWIVTAEPRSTAELEKSLLEAGVKPELLKAAAFIQVPHGNIWMRDYGPVLVADMSQKAPEGGRISFADLKYDGAAGVNDDFPRALGKLLSIPTAEVPVLVDGGNLLAAGDFCITSSTNLALSNKDSGHAELEPGPDALATRYGGALGCRSVLVVRNPPHEHVDMWIKAVSRDTVLVNDLSADTLKLVKAQYGHIPADLGELKARLDDGARQLAAQGLKVERLPMPIPYRGAFRTFANAVFINGTAIVPSFKRYGWGYDEYPDARLEAGYEAKARRIYARHGFKTRFVNADGLIFNGGGFHCVMLQIPALAGLKNKGH